MTRTRLRLHRRGPSEPGSPTSRRLIRSPRPGGPSLTRPEVAGLELAPVSIELMADLEREAALDALAELYDSIGRPFQLLSVPAERDPGEHLAATDGRVEGRRIDCALAAYAALYREIAGAPRRRLRRTFLLFDATSDVERRRVLEGILRTAEERCRGT